MIGLNQSRKFRNRQGVRFAAAAAAGLASLLAQSRHAGAQTYTWSTPGSSGNFSTGFTPTVAAGPTSQLVFTNTNATGYTASNDLGAFQLNSLSVSNTNASSNASNPVYITSSSGQPLIFNGSNPQLNFTDVGATNISSPITSVAGMVYNNSGAGTVMLGGSQTFAANSTTTIINSGPGTLITADCTTVPIYGTNILLNLANTGTGQFLLGDISVTSGVLNSGPSGTINVSQGYVTAANSGGDLFDNFTILNVAAGATFDFSNNGETMGGIGGSGTIVLGTASLTFVEAGNTSWSGNISGSGGVTQDNAYVFSLGGSNTYTGTTEVAAGGVILLTNANAIPSGSLVDVDSGSLVYGGNYNQSFKGLEGGNQSGFFNIGSSTLTLTPTSSYAFLSPITGTGNIVLNASAGVVQTLLGTNTYSGTTTVLSGTLRITGNGLLAGGATTVAAGAGLDVILTGNGYWVTPLTDAGSFVKEGAGNLTFNTSMPGMALTNLQVSGGTLTLDHTHTNASEIGTGSMSLGLGSGTLALLGNSSAISSQTFSGTTLNGGAQISVTAGNGFNASIAAGALNRSLNLGSTINFALTNNGSGIASVTTTTNNNTAGTLGGYATINGTSWAVGATGGTATAITGLPNSSYGTNVFSANHVDVGSSFTVGTSGASAYDVRFNTSSANKLTLKGADSLTYGGILVTPNVGANVSTIAGGTGISLTAPANQDLIVQQFNPLAALNISSAIANTAGTTFQLSNASVTIAGTSYKENLTLSSTAGISIGEHVVALNASGGTLIGNSTNGSNAIVTAINSSTSISLQYSTTPASDTATTLQFTPGTNLVKSGPGQLILAGANSFAGMLVLNQGVTTISSASNLGSTSGTNSSSVYFNGGTLEITSGAPTDSTGIQPWIIGPAGATLQIDTATTTVSKVGNTLWGTGDIYLTGPGTFDVGSTSSSFTGRIFVQNGGFQLTSNQVTSSEGIIISSGAQFILHDTTSGPYNLGPGAALTLNGNGPNGTGGAWLHNLDEAGTADTKPDFNSQVILASTSRFVETDRADANASGGYDICTDVFPLAISGPGNLIKDGNGVLVLASPFNTYGTPTNPTTIVSNGILQLAATNGVPSNNTLQVGETGSSNSGTFDLNGQQQTVVNLTSGGSGASNQIINSNTSNAAILTVNYSGTSNQVFSPAIGGSGSGNINFVKTGTGTFTLAGTTNFNGSVNVSAGALRIYDTTSNHDYSVSDGATLIITNTTGNTLQANSLTMGNTGTTNLNFELTAGNPGGGLLNVNNGVTLNGTVNISLNAVQALSTGIFPLITYNGTLGGAGFSALHLATLPSSRDTGILLNDNGSIDLDITSVDFLRWSGAVNGNWDVNTTPNFVLNSNGTATTYLDQPSADAVVFDDSLTGTSNVTLNTVVNPSSVMVNNSNEDYTFSGTGSINGSTGLMKSGNGNLNILTNNAYTGPTTILGGAIVVGNGGTIGSLGSGAIIDNSSLVINRSDNLTLANSLTGSGSITKAGNNTLTLTGVLNLSGGAIVNGGNLVLGSGVIGGITGAGSFTKTGIGTLAVSGDINNTGGANISAGTLQIGNGGTSGTLAYSVNLPAGANLGFGRSDTSTYAGNITGAGGLVGTSGHMILTGSLGYTGPTSIAAASTIEYAGNSGLVYDNVISGTGSFIWNSPAQLTLLNINTFTGTFTVNNGIVQLEDLGQRGALDASSIVVNNGGRFIFGLGPAYGGPAGENPDFPDTTTFLTITTGGTFEFRVGENYAGTSLQGGTFILNGAVGATQAYNGSGPATFSGFDAQAGTIIASNTSGGVGTITANYQAGFTKSTSGEVDVQGPVAIASATAININQGVLSFQPINVPTTGTAPITLGGGILRMTGAGAGTISRQVTVNADSSIDLDNTGGTLTLTKPVTGGANLFKTGPGTLVMPPSPLSGTTTISAGTLTLQSAVPSTASGAFSVADGATLGVGLAPATIPTVSFGTVGSTLAFNLNYNAPSAPLLVVSNSNGINTNGGNETITLSNLPTLQAGQEFQLIGYNGNTLSSGFSLAPLGGRITAGVVYNSSSSTIDVDVTSVGGAITWSGAVSSTWDVGTAANVGGTNNFTLSGSPTNFITGDTVVFDDTLTPGSNNISVIAGGVAPTAITFNNSSTTYTIGGPGAITGTTGLLKLGTGTTILTADNTFTGTTNVSAGTLQLGNNTSTGSVVSPLILIASGANLVVNRSADLTYTGQLSGTGTLTKLGSSTLYLTGDSTPFTGNVNVSGGTILLENPDAQDLGNLNASLITINSGARFIFGLGPAYGGPANENPNFPDTTLLTINTGGTFEIRVGEQYGAISLRGGTFLSNGAVGSTLNANPTNDPTAAYYGFDLQSGTVMASNTGTGSATLTSSAVDGGFNKSTSGLVSVIGPVLISSATPINILQGTLSFQLQNVPASGTAAITFGSATTSGTLQLADTGIASIARPVTLASGGGVISLPNANESLTFTSNIAGTGSLTTSGLGGLVLSGSNAYTGDTVVSGGQLTLTTTGSIASSAHVNVSSGATFTLAASTATSLVGVLPRSLGQLNVNGNAVFATAVNQGNRQIVSATGISIGGNGSSYTGRLDVGNNDVDVVNAGTLGLASINAAAVAGYNGGSWNGTGGIVSSAAAGDPTHLTALGVILNSNNGTTSGTPLYGSATGSLGLFDGLNPSVSDVLIKYTYYGDTNLSGLVDGSDYSRVDTTYGNEAFVNGVATNPISGWYNGDFNYDGVVDGSDYTLMDNAFNQEGAALSTAIATPTAQIGTAQIGAGTSAVPEPTTIGLLGLGALGLLGRRKRV
jgi:autotransporter-associated beta strand protein